MTGLQSQGNSRRRVRPWLLGFFGAVSAVAALVALVGGYKLRRIGTEEIPWRQFIGDLRAGNIESVTVEGRSYSGTYLPGAKYRRFRTEGPDIGADAELAKLIAGHAELEIRKPSRLFPR